MMKKHIFFILFVLFSFSAFAHKAQKQTEKLMPEALTQKWLAVARASGMNERRCAKIADEIFEIVKEELCEYL